jgi:hypothetical protein
VIGVAAPTNGEPTDVRRDRGTIADEDVGWIGRRLSERRAGFEGEYH